MKASAAAFEWRRGWRIVAAAATGMGAGTGLLALTAGLFVRPLEEAFGWSRAEIATLSLLGLLSAVAMPAFGMLVDRKGARRVAAVGMLLLGMTLVAFSMMTGALWQFYAIGTVLAIAGVATTPVVLTRPIGMWFDASRGTALGLTMSGVSVTAVIYYPVLQHVIETHGWRYGYLALAALPLIVGAPVVYRFLRDRPAETGLGAQARMPAADAKNPPGRWPRIVRDRRFWLLAAAMFVANLPVGGILSQLQPLLADRGVSGASAALMGSVFAGSIAVGRIATGFLLDVLFAPAVAATCLLLPVCGLLAMADPEPALWVAYASAFLFGLAQGAEADFSAFFIPRYFGMELFGSVMGVIMLIVAVSLALGGVLFAAVFDRWGDYRPALLAGAIALPVASAAILAMGFERRGCGELADSKA